MKKILKAVAQAIYDKKGVNILTLDVRGISTITDYFVIAEGTVDRHVKALSDAVSKTLDEQGFKIIHQEGQQSGEWIVLDYGELMVHLFVPDLREKYSLEQVWHEGKIVDVPITISKDSQK